MGVTDLAVAAGAISPTGRHDYMVALFEPRSFGYDAADLAHHAGDLVTERDRGLDVGVWPEIAVHQLHVRSTHPTGFDLHQDLIGLDVGNWDVFQNERFAVLVQASSFHVRTPCA